MTFNAFTVIEETSDENFIESDGFNFTPLIQIEDIVQQVTIDVIGVILDVEPVSQIQLRSDGSYKDKR